MMWIYRPRPIEPERVPTGSNYAKHLRGKVSIQGRGERTALVVMAVVNTNTGQVIASDNVALHTVYGRGTGLAHMVQDATETTTAARLAWMRGFGHKGLR